MAAPLAFGRATRSDAGRARDPILSGLIALAILAGFAFLGILLYAVQFSGSARWIAGMLLVALLALVATYAVVRRTSRPASLEATPRADEIRDGELASLAEVVERAGRGLGFSQALIVGRARDGFLERVRLERGLAPDAIRRLERDADGLRAVVRDAVLGEFLLATRDREEREAWATGSRRGGGFDAAIRGILARMEAWR